MRKWLNKPWFVALLAVAALGAAVHSVLSDRPDYGANQPSAVVANDEAVQEAAESAQPSEVSSNENPVSTVGLREIFAPPARNGAPEAVDEPKVTTKREQFLLSALWAQTGRLFCLLNGRICQVGDSVGSARIESANLEGVWIAHELGRDFVALGQPFTLTLPVSLPGAAEPRS